MVTNDKVITLTEKDTKNVSNMKVIGEGKLSITLPKDAETLKVAEKGKVLYLPPSEELPFGYSGMVEQKNANGTVVLREATLEEVFDELDIDFNSSRDSDKLQVGLISANPNVKMQMQPQGHQVGIWNKDYEHYYQNCSLENTKFSLLNGVNNFINKYRTKNSKSGQKLDLNIPFPLSADSKYKETNLNISMETGCQPIKNNRFATKYDKVGSKFIINFKLPFKDKVTKREATISFNLNLEDILINKKIKYKDKKWHDFTQTISGNATYELGLTGKFVQANLYQLAGGDTHKVWDNLKLGTGNEKGKFYGEIYGLDSKDKIGLLPLGGFVITPVTTKGKAGNVDFSGLTNSKDKIISVVVWVYLRADGTLSLEGKIATGMEKVQFQKGIISTANSNGELVPTVLNNVDEPVFYNTLDGTAKAEIKMGATISADLLIAGIRPATVQFNPITYTQVDTLKGNAKHIWYSKNPKKPAGISGSLCYMSERSLYTDLFLSLKLGAKAKFFGWEQKTEASYSDTYRHDWWKNNKQERCIMAGQPLQASFSQTPVTNVPKVINLDIDYSKSFSEHEKNILIDNWKVKVYNHNTKQHSYITLPKNSNGKATFSLPYGYNYDVSLVAMGNPFSEKTEREIVISKATNFNLGTDPSKVKVTSVDVSPKQPTIGEKYRVTIKGDMLLSSFNLSGCISPKLVDFSQYQAIYECTAPNAGQSLLLNIASADGKHQYYKTGVEIQERKTTTATKLTATGITLCGDDSRNDIVCSSLSSAWLGLKQDGQVQAGQKMSYEKRFYNKEECVIDKVTGLTWEQKTDDGGLRDKDNTYTWYNPDNRTNGGDKGSENNGKNTHEYIKQLNASNYCGYNNWRLPTYDELNSIVDYGRHNPAINPIFSNTQSSLYWSSSPNANYYSNAWGVDFNYGNGYYYYKTNSNYVRAVR